MSASKKMAAYRAALPTNLRSQYRGFSKVLESEMLDRYIDTLSDDELAALANKIEMVSEFELSLLSNILIVAKSDPDSDLHKLLARRRTQQHKQRVAKLRSKVIDAMGGANAN